MADRFVPIRFLGPDGTPASPTDASAVPVIDVVLHPPKGEPGESIPAIALIDTGCDYGCVVDTVLDRVTGRHVRDIDLGGVAGRNDSVARDCTIELIFNDGSRVLCGADVVRVGAMRNSPYTVIIGRALLGQGCLVMDRFRGVYRFTIEP
ncbi:hypothetical protein LDO31_03120 [Luteimonas sp. XNQY3]|nr:hypothetical protein [Luteimonas sp. XNQY3]MCD9005239.1 hypothetical protein [Luteimonas sp. XNQY3]